MATHYAMSFLFQYTMPLTHYNFCLKSMQADKTKNNKKQQWKQDRSLQKSFVVGQVKKRGVSTWQVKSRRLTANQFVMSFMPYFLWSRVTHLEAGSPLKASCMSRGRGAVSDLVVETLELRLEEAIAGFTLSPPGGIQCRMINTQIYGDPHSCI